MKDKTNQPPADNPPPDKQPPQAMAGPGSRAKSTKVSEIYGGRYLTAEDWNGGLMRTTIIGVSVQQMPSQDGQPPRLKIILDLEGLSKSLALNSGNAAALAIAIDDDCQQWLGREIMVGVSPTKYQGKIVPGLIVSLAPDKPR